MFLRFVLRALRFRRQRLLLAFAALAVAAALATVLIGIYATVGRRIGEEFRAYGANLVAVPAGGATLPIGLAAAAEKLGASAAPFLITSARIGDRRIAVAGFDPARTLPMTSYWHVNGTRGISVGECLAGASLARELQMSVGSHIALSPAPCVLRGIVSTGGVEDREMLVPFESAAAIAGVKNVASLIEIRAPGDRLEAIRASLTAAFPDAEVRTIRSVAATETNVVTRIRGSVFLLTGIILAITTLCVCSNFNEMVIERSREIGILKALGGAERRIASFFLSESALLALCAAVIGYLAGSLAAAAIGRQIFGGAFHLDVSLPVFLIVTAVILAVAGVATALSGMAIRRIEPAIILRGD